MKELKYDKVEIGKCYLCYDDLMESWFLGRVMVKENYKLVMDVLCYDTEESPSSILFFDCGDNDAIHEIPEWMK